MKPITDINIENKIIELYQNSSNSIRKIAKEIGLSTSTVTRILQQKGLYIYSDNLINNKNNNRFENVPGFKWVAICKKTKLQFDDYLNSSGKLTRHITSEYKDYVIESGFKRRQYELKTGKFWYEDFFDIIKVEDENSKKEKKKCPFCEWTTVDLENRSGAFTSHLRDVHNKNIIEYTQEYPNDINLFNTFFNKLNNQLNTISKKENFVECKLCNKKMRRITNSHLLNVHNISLNDYKINYGTTLSHETLKKIKLNYDINLKNLPSFYTSKGQMEIVNFIEQHGFKCNINNKSILKGVELDIIVENTQLAIEYNGLLYHSELYGKKQKNFHKIKSELANLNEYKLIHIFEDEWRHKPEIIKSKVLNLLNKTPNKIHGRKCQIKNVNPLERNVFLNNNHLLGGVSHAITYGAYYNEELVAVMCFNNKRNMVTSKQDLSTFELTRFCSKLYTNINGIANKLLKRFIIDFQPKKIVSFAERTWTNFDSNNLYTKLGFAMTNVLKPDYKYFNRKEHNPVKLHKFAFGKSSLQRKFPQIYDANKTEWEMMQELGYDRIWDCGKWKYELILE